MGVHFGYLAPFEGSMVGMVVAFCLMMLVAKLHFSSDPTRGASLPSWLLPALLVVFGVIALVAFRRMLPPQAAVPAESREPDAISLSGDWALDPIRGGGPVSLSSFRGKSVFVNVWATWCPPCVAEMPSIQKLAQRLSNDKDVAFVMVSLDNSPDVVIDFMKENGYALPVFMPRANPPKELRSQGVPLTVILDRDQKVRFRHMGSQDWNTPEVAQMLRKYAKESSSTTAPEAAKSSESSPKKGTP